MKKAGIALIIILLIVFTGLAVKNFYFSNSQSKTKISEESVQQNRDQDTSTQIDKATITLFSQDGTTKWVLEADTIQQFEKKPKVALKQITAQVYKEGEQVISLTAKQGEADTKTGFLAFEGPIEIKGEQRTLKVDKLNWNQAKDELIGSGNVVFKKPGMTLTGQSFIARIDLKKVRIKGQAQAIYNKAGEKDEE